MTMLNGAVDSAKNAFGSARSGAEVAMDAAKHAVENAKDKGEHVASTVRSTFLDRVNALSGLIAAVGALRADDALGWVGLARRRGSLATFGLFSAGFAAGAAVGAGAGLLFAPTSGSELRQRIARSVESFGREGEKAIHDVEAKVNEVKTEAKDKVDHMKTEAKDKVDHMKTEAREKLGELKTDAKEMAGKARDGAGQKDGAVENKSGKPTTDFS